MKKITTLCLAVLLISILLITFYSFAEERVTLTTYYPAPYGVYRELRANQMAIGSGYRNTPLADGFLIVNGNVGIGTTNPQANLDIDGSVRVMSGTMTINNMTIDESWLPNPSFQGTTYTTRRTFDFYPQGTDNSIAMHTRGAKKTALVTDGPIMSIESGAYFAGSVGIGTSNPSNKLDVEGGAVIGAAYSGSNTAPVNGLLVEGNVGIGTQNPTAKLEVAGQIKITGGVPALNKILTSDATGMASWQHAGWPPGSYCIVRTSRAGGCPVGFTQTNYWVSPGDIEDGGNAGGGSWTGSGWPPGWGHTQEGTSGPMTSCGQDYQDCRGNDEDRLQIILYLCCK